MPIPSGRRSGAMIISAAIVLAAGSMIVTITLISSNGQSTKAEPDYEAVVRDTVSIMFPGATPSNDDIKQLLPSTKRSTDVACDNLAHMPRAAVVEYTNISIQDRTKADLLVSSMERNVCSRS